MESHDPHESELRQRPGPVIPRHPSEYDPNVPDPALAYGAADDVREVTWVSDGWEEEEPEPTYEQQEKTFDQTVPSERKPWLERAAALNPIIAAAVIIIPFSPLIGMSKASGLDRVLINTLLIASILLMLTTWRLMVAYMKSGFNYPLLQVNKFTLIVQTFIASAIISGTAFTVIVDITNSIDADSYERMAQLIIVFMLIVTPALFYFQTKTIRKSLEERKSASYNVEELSILT